MFVALFRDKEEDDIREQDLEETKIEQTRDEAVEPYTDAREPLKTQRALGYKPRNLLRHASNSSQPIEPDSEEKSQVIIRDKRELFDHLSKNPKLEKQKVYE
jgi:uncharacterized membrane-anchored protein YhcB (DUF1043 family)